MQFQFILGTALGFLVYTCIFLKPADQQQEEDQPEEDQ